MTPTPREDTMTEQTEQEQKAPCVHCGRTDWRWTGECWFDDPAAGPPSYRRVEIRCDWCKPLRMDAYYFGFGGTGVELVDRVLSAVAMAGKGYHHTESWGDEGQEDWGPFRGGDYVSWIQNAANDVAALLRERDAQIAHLSAQVEQQKADKWYWVGVAMRDAKEIYTLLAERDAERQRWMDARCREVEQSIRADRAEAERDAAQQTLERCREVQQTTAEAWRIEHEEMMQQIATLTAALERYGEHERDCSVGIDDIYARTCTCGLAALQSTRPQEEV